MSDNNTIKKRYYTVEEMAVIYMVKPSTIRKWAKIKKLDGEKIGKRWLFEIPAFIRKEQDENLPN